jgi:hypothetical protein
VDREIRREGCTFLGAFVLEHVLQDLDEISIIPGFIVLYSLLYSLLDIIIIYTFIPN